MSNSGAMRQPAPYRLQQRAGQVVGAHGYGILVSGTVAGTHTCGGVSWLWCCSPGRYRRPELRDRKGASLTLTRQTPSRPGWMPVVCRGNGRRTRALASGLMRLGRVSSQTR
jgi:hypothetical protein